MQNVNQFQTEKAYFYYFVYISDTYFIQKFSSKCIIIFFAQHKLMKFLIAAVAITTAYCQQTLLQVDPIAPSPVSLIEEDIETPEIKVNKKDQIVEPVPQNKIQQETKEPQAEKIEIAQIQINPTFGGDSVDATIELKATPLLGKQEFNPYTFQNHDHSGPIPGSIQFNQDMIEQQQKENDDPFIRKDHEFKRDGKHLKKYEKKHENKKEKNHERDGKDGKEMKRKHRNKQDDQELPGMMDYEGWEKHVGKEHKRGKYHKGLWIGFLFASIIFTLFGICLHKCTRKCLKNKKKKITFVSNTKSSSQIREQIAKKEKKIKELKEEYKNKKAEQDIAARQQAQYRNYERNMRQARQQSMHMNRQNVEFYQPRYMVQPVHITETQIPMGRPINQSANSSFASEYPSL